jgi:membrane protease YdiL (CAAX protease family)
VSRGALFLLYGYHLLATAITHLHKLGGSVAYLAGVALFARPLWRLLDHYLVRSWREINKETARTGKDRVGDHYDFRPLMVLCTAAVSLTLMRYFGGSNSMPWVNRLGETLLSGRYRELVGLGYWVLARLVVYVLIPWIVVLFWRGERLRDYGLSPRHFGRHLAIYGLLFLIVLPPLVMVSFTAPFLQAYPFYKMAGRSWMDLLLWEAMYAVQFFALEVFFRGFMIHPLRRSLGAYSVLVMALPYCMIHYNKPLAEVFGAMVAGTVLGTLSLRTRSIWPGVLVHVSVALSMDLLALFHTTGYPGNPRLAP